jgi:NTE family protein
MRGLVLTAGGARGAYQAGVLRGVGELRSLRDRPSPFSIVTGASAGAINGAIVACGSLEFRESTRRLARIWSELSVGDVFKADPLSLGWNGARLVRDFSYGVLFGGAGTRSLLDTAPLRAFLGRHLRFGGIKKSIDAGVLHAVAISATSYHSGKSFTFVEGRPEIALWNKSRRVALPTALNVDHILASSAIPIVFPPVRVATKAGELHFGDGALRLVNPLSPAIRLGASRLFAVGIRCHSSAAELWQAESGGHEGSAAATSLASPPLSQICGVFMNAIFLDHLDADLDHLLRMNQLVEAHRQVSGGSDGFAAGGAVQEPIRSVQPLMVTPSEDLALVASRYASKMPRLIRHMMDGLGTPDAQSADLMSYLLFDSAYLKTLVDIGWRDADARIDEIETFLAAEVAAAA